MSDQYVSVTRQRFIKDMQIKRLLPKTQRMYRLAMRGFTQFLRRSPDSVTTENLGAFQLDMKGQGVDATIFNNRLTAFIT